MSVPAGVSTPETDPRDAVLVRLGNGLRGPRRVRADLLTELRDGLEDATDDLIAAGVEPAAARHQAVAEFGDPAELAAELQAELAGVQARRTALTVAAGSLAMEAAWDWGYPEMMRGYLLSGHRLTEPPVWGQAGLLAQMNQIQVALVWIVAPLLLIAYAGMARRTTPVRRLALLIGLLSVGLLTFVLLLSGLMTTSNPNLLAVLREQPEWLVFQGASLIGLLALVGSSVRTLRTLR